MTNKKNKIFMLVSILLFFIIIGLMCYIFLDSNDKENKRKKEVKIEEKNIEVKDDTKLSNTTEDISKEYLQVVTKVYNEAYNTINSHEAYTEYNESELSPYFTKKSLDTIQKQISSSNDASPAFFTGIFGKINQGARTIKIVTAHEDIIVAQGQLTNGQYDNDPYPLYIIFKNEDNSWKIDLYE